MKVLLLLLLILVALRIGNRSVKVCRLGRSSVDRNSTLFMYGVPGMECSMHRTGRLRTLARRTAA